MNAFAGKSIPLIAFDWDNTIVDSFGLLESAHKLTAKDFNIDENNSKIKDPHFWALPSTVILETLYGADNVLLAKERFDKNYYSLIENDLKLMPYAREVIEKLYEESYNLAIISNKSYFFLERELQIFNLEKYFKTIVGSRGKKEEDKPNINALEIALKRLDMQNVEKSKIWYIGDSEIDAHFAKNTGIKCAIVNKNVATISFKFEPDIMISSLTAIDKIFSQDY
jgi:phosphoglycolate phosphatase